MYVLRIGAGGPGSGDIYNGGGIPGSITSRTANIPANGVTAYVTVYYRTGGSWYATTDTFMEGGAPTAPALTSPSKGAVLSGPTMFQWPGGSGVQLYELYIGTAGVESRDIYFSGALTAANTARTISIPAQGKKVYVRLRYEQNNVWNNLDYTFSEAP
jgi:hypothetical protein